MCFHKYNQIIKKLGTAQFTDIFDRLPYTEEVIYLLKKCDKCKKLRLMIKDNDNKKYKLGSVDLEKFLIKNNLKIKE